MGRSGSSRSSSSGSSSRSSSPRSSSTRTQAPPSPTKAPATVPQSHAPAHAPASHPPAAPAAPTPMAPAAGGGGGGLLSGIGSTIVSGMAFGTGSAIAHRAVDAVVGPREMTVNHVNEGPAEPASAPAPVSSYSSSSMANPCTSQMKSFNDCLNSSNNDISACQYYFDMLQQCKTQSSQNSFQ